MEKNRCLSIVACVFAGLLLLTSCAPQQRAGAGNDLGTPSQALSTPELSTPTKSPPSESAAPSPSARIDEDAGNGAQRIDPATEPQAQAQSRMLLPDATPEAAPEAAAEAAPQTTPEAQPAPEAGAQPQAEASGDAQAAEASSAAANRAKISPTTRMSYQELIADNKDYKTPRSFPSKGTYRIYVDLTNQIMTVYGKNGDIVRQMLCSTGKKQTPSPRGKFRMGRDRVRFGYFKSFDCYAQYWTQVTRNIYIHSVLYSKKSDKTIIRASYRNLGKAVSHGCIRLTVPDARWIYQNIAPGTVIEFGKRAKDEALRSELKLPSIPSSKKK